MDINWKSNKRFVVATDKVLTFKSDNINDKSSSTSFGAQISRIKYIDEMKIYILGFVCDNQQNNKECTTIVVDDQFDFVIRLAANQAGSVNSIDYDPISGYLLFFDKTYSG